MKWIIAVQNVPSWNNTDDAIVKNRLYQYLDEKGEFYRVNQRWLFKERFMLVPDSYVNYSIFKLLC